MTDPTAVLSTELLRTSAATAVLADWTDISSQWESSPYATNVRDACGMIQA